MYLNKAQCDQCKHQYMATCVPNWEITHVGTVFDHTLEVLKNLNSTNFTVQIAALFHDVGKTEYTHQINEGKIQFIDHEHYGAYKARKILKDLKFDNQTVDDVCFLIKHHMDIHRLEKCSKKTYRKFVRDIPQHLIDDLFDLVDADGLGTHIIDETGHVNNIPTRSQQRIIVHQTVKELKTFDAKPFRYLNGHQLMDLLNISTGKLVGQAVSIMLDLQDEFGHDADLDEIKRLIVERFELSCGGE